MLRSILLRGVGLVTLSLVLISNARAQTTTPFPLQDDAEDAVASNSLWTADVDTWAVLPTGAAHSGSGVWEVTATSAQPKLTLTNPIDLSSAENPYLSFWMRSESATYGIIDVDVSSDGGVTWTQVYESSPYNSGTWLRAQVSLTEQRQPNVLLRFRAREYSGNPTLQIDDIELSGDLPGKAISISASTIDFGRGQVGTATSRVFNVRNLGTQAVSGTVSISGAAFSLQDEVSAFSIEPQQTFAVTVDFAPTEETTFYGSLTITHDAENLPSPFSVSLKGRAGAAGAGSICRDLAVAVGWNLVSVPVGTEDSTATVVFPGTSNHYSFDEGEYNGVTKLAPGAGYWLKSPAADTTEVCGLPVDDRSVTLRAGWNLIGGFEGDIATSTVTVNPSDATLSSFFGFSSGYKPAVVLQPGRGYWVKVSKAGTLTMAASLGKTSPALAAESLTRSDWIKLVVEDAHGETSTLFLAPEAVDELQAILPPRPPSGVFDVRFTSDRFVEQVANGSHEVALQAAAYPVRVRAEDLDGRVLLIDGGPGGSAKADLSEGDEVVLDAGQKLLRVTVQELPKEYQLEQSYPNPFRSTATIRYGLPEAAHVTISVYDLLGKRVAVLVDQDVPAGYRQVEFDGEGLASGVYFYVIQAGSYRAVRKMVLQK
ncbi:MAG TPA: T9SS type A sorting domain-containing protein [Rhodothermales bacterium]|nr:T9SS type A sorting domain-containing protein [Rhodothermales bacterium]